jgi:hypothetical protein
LARHSLKAQPIEDTSCGRLQLQAAAGGKSRYGNRWRRLYGNTIWTMREPGDVAHAPTESDFVFLIAQTDFVEEVSYVGCAAWVEIDHFAMKLWMLERNHLSETPRRRLGQMDAGWRAYLLHTRGYDR